MAARKVAMLRLNDNRTESGLCSLRLAIGDYKMNVCIRPLPLALTLRPVQAFRLRT
jgi:hypothetical protein